MSDFDIEVKWFDDKVTPEIIDKSMTGLQKWGEAIVGEAKKQTPVLTGTLMRSITVTRGGLPSSNNVYQEAKSTTGDKSVVINQSQGEELAVYISANTPYARRQHEEHSSKAKYLERPFMQYKDKAKILIEKELKKL